MNLVRNKALFAAIVVTLCMSAGHQSRAADAAPETNRYAATIAPAERFEVGGVLVERHGKAGNGGRALILIPGLASGSWVWQDTIGAFAPDHAVYVLTLPGFDGRPPAGPARPRRPPRGGGPPPAPPPHDRPPPGGAAPP
ncbi:alpha/beta fold hydrolase, partial [Massilia sp. CT11-108]|uniref:alpha/beta fold hydrolase n=1 Tax=Massilia sp. CT11-108 TaxID=3393900 RepID=UPI0039A472FC